jgi:HSP20 family protein
MFSLMPSRRVRRESSPLATREYTPFELLRREFAPLFDRAFPSWLASFEPQWFETEPWRLAMEETDREYVVRAEMPGFAPNEVEVRLTGGVLTMRAEHTEAATAEAKEPVERRYRVWERTVTLPPGIVPEKVEARCHNGVLEVHVPKAPELEPRRIEVKT